MNLQMHMQRKKNVFSILEGLNRAATHHNGVVQEGW